MQLIKIILICAICLPTLFAQTNIVKNGSFSDESSWALEFYNDSKGNSIVADGLYRIMIEKPGSDPWSVQFTQTGLSIDSGSYYKFSFEVSSNLNRTIEASISKNGGDYISYSGRDSIEVTPIKKRFEFAFMMKYKSDMASRIEFNCGKYDGNVVISNVELIKISGPLIKTQAPAKDDILYEGNPFRITWFSIGVDSVKLELSSDNGLSWIEIIPSIPDTGAFNWTPTGNYSPWSIVRVSSKSNPDIKAVTALFEIVPSTELVRKKIERVVCRYKISSRKVITIFNNSGTAGSSDHFSKSGIVNLMGRSTKAAATYNRCSFSKSTATGLYIYALKRPLKSPNGP